MLPYNRVVFIAVLLSYIPLSAQTEGTIIGRVIDPAQSSVPQARVELTNEATGISSTQRPGSDGSFLFPRLMPGVYHLTASASGFKAISKRGIVLQVNQTARVDFQLEVGAVSASVEVDARAPMIQSDTTSVGSVVDGAQIEDMPLNGRTDIYGLLALAPGVQNSGSNPAIAGSAFRGGTGATIDGVSNDDAINERLLGQMPSLDSVAEFKVIVNAAPAEFGKSAQIIIASKGGSNVTHGALFAFNRNAVGAARTHSVRNLAKPAYNRNEYGGQISGRIIKNKLFYTGSFEGLRLVQSTVSQLSVPRQSMKTGDLSLYLPTTIKDPLAGGVPFAGNIIPVGRISATSKEFLRFFADPNTPGTGSLGLGTNFATNVPQHQPNDRYSTRIDYQISDKDSVYGRYFWTSNGPYSTAGGGLPFGQWDGFGISSKNLAAQYTRVVSSTVANIFRLGMNYWTDYRMPQNHLYDPSKFVQGLTAPLDMLGGAPSIAISGYNTVSDQPGSDDHNHVRQFIDHVTWQRAKHSFKFGFEIADVAVVNRQNSTPYRGSFSFDGRYSGNAWADYMLGYLSASARTTSNFILDDTQTRLAAFAQDDWRITNRLTLNLGLRYDYSSAWNKHNELAVWDRDLNALSVVSGKADPLWNGVVPLVDAKTLGVNAGNYMNFGKLNFSPRAGLAYRPFNKPFVIRTAYGIFYNAMSEYDGAVDLRDLGLNPPFRASQNFLGVNSGVPNLTWSDAWAGTGTSSAGTPPNIYAVDKNFRLGYNQQWNVTLEWEPMRDTSIRASYVGSKATHFVQAVNINDPLPSALPIQPRRAYQPWGNIYYYEANRNQLFNQLQLGAIRRFKGGLRFQAEYQFSRSLGGDSQGAVPTTWTNLRLDRGNTSQYVRHYMVFNYNYDLPFGHGKKIFGGVRGPLDKMISGWQLSGIGTVATGSFYSISFTSNKTGWNSGRADIVGNPSIDNPNEYRYFNTAAFAVPAAYTFGNSAPNLMQGPGRYNLDTGLFKSTHLTERVSLAVRLEAFNVANHANLGNPGANVSSPSTFGYATARNGSRITQLGARLSF